MWIPAIFQISGLDEVNTSQPTYLPGMKVSDNPGVQLVKHFTRSRCTQYQQQFVVDRLHIHRVVGIIFGEFTIKTLLFR